MRRQTAAFTLVEILITLSIISVLLALMLPALSRVRGTSESFNCKMTMRNAAFDFQMFADSRAAAERGDDASLIDRFRLETFQEAEYGIDEFWAHDTSGLASLEGTFSEERTRCASVGGSLTARQDAPCSEGGIGPARFVSYGYNFRLHKREAVARNGRVRLSPVLLTEQILDFGSVPLAIDVDGREAERRGVSPVFTAPSLGSTGPLGNDRVWFPSFRHGGLTNISFMDGHVESTDSPVGSSNIMWGFEPGL